MALHKKTPKLIIISALFALGACQNHASSSRYGGMSTSASGQSGYYGGGYGANMSGGSMGGFMGGAGTYGSGMSATRYGGGTYGGGAYGMNGYGTAMTQPMMGGMSGYGSAMTGMATGQPAQWEMSPSVTATANAGTYSSGMTSGAMTGQMMSNTALPMNTSCSGSAAACSYVTEIYNTPSSQTSYGGASNCPAGSSRVADGTCESVTSGYSSSTYTPSTYSAATNTAPQYEWSSDTGYDTTYTPSTTTEYSYPATSMPAPNYLPHKK